MSTVYLAYGSGANETLERHAEQPVDLLVAVPFLESFYKHRHKFNVSRWCLDSGAFSAQNSGKKITYSQWYDAATQCDAFEIFGLDVIFDENKTRTNLERAWGDGIEAIPTYHRGSKWESLKWCCDNATKIALGGGATLKSDVQRIRWVGHCFARCWPHQIHGFACSSAAIIDKYPFHSVDASSWIYAPGAFGRWCGFTGKQMNLRSRGVHDYWVEVLEHKKRARRAQQRWRKELQLIAR